MSPELEELRRLGESAEPVQAALDWAVAVGRARLLELHDEIEALRFSEEWRRDATWQQLRGPEAALSVAELASARTVAQAARALDHHVGDAITADDVIRAAQEHGARWLPKLPQRLVRNRWNNHWRLGRELVRRGLAEHPTDPLYHEQMITQIGRVYASLTDDEALREEIWSFFQSDRLGLVMGQHDLPAERSMHRTPQWPDEDLFWRAALAALAQVGRVDRVRLHRATLAGLAMDAPWVRVRWYGAMLDQLNCTIDEIASETGSYLALLRSRNPKAVAVGQRAVKALLGADRLRPEEFLDAADAPLYGTDKATALAQIKMLEGFLATPAWRDDALTTLLPALGHRNLDVQRAALRLVARHADAVGDGLRKQIALAAEGLAPSLRTELLVAPSPPAPIVAVVVNTETMPGPLDDAAFVQVAALMLEDQARPIEIDRAIEAMLRICGYPLEQQRALVEPLLRRAGDPAVARTELRGWTAGCIRLLAGDTLASTNEAERVGELLLMEVWQAIKRGVARPYIAMPTRPDGSIDAATAAERRRAVPAGVGPGETIVAALRADDGRDLLRFDGIHVVIDADRHRLTTQGVPFSFAGSMSTTVEVAGVTPEREPWSGSYTVGTEVHHYVTPGRPLITGAAGVLVTLTALGPRPFGAGAEYLEWLFTTLPHHPDAIVIPLAWAIADDMEREPTAFLPSRLNTILDHASRPGRTVGGCASIVAAMALGAKAAGTRLRAIDCVSVLVRDKGVDVGAIAGPLAQLLTEQAVKPSRVAGSLADAAATDPRLVRDIVLPLLPSILGLRDAHRLLDALTEAIALTGPAAVPAEVHELATRKGASKLIQSARHLVAVSASAP